MEYMESKMQEQIEAGVSERERCYNEIAELEHFRDALAAKVVEVTAERDALAAQLQALRSHLQTMTKRANHVDPSERDAAIKCLKATPQQHLAEIRAQAVSSCADKLGDTFILPHNLRKETQKAEFYKAGWRDSFLFIKQYADSIRQEK